MSEEARILVVDDEQSMREFLEIFFRREGFDVVTTGDVDSASPFMMSSGTQTWTTPGRPRYERRNARFKSSGIRSKDSAAPLHLVIGLVTAS